jgi:hypothetical protein
MLVGVWVVVAKHGVWEYVMKLLLTFAIKLPCLLDAIPTFQRIPELV